MKKLYVNEIRSDGYVSTVGLFYSRAEAENVVAQLGKIPEKHNCRYEITDIVPLASSTRLMRKRSESLAE